MYKRECFDDCRVKRLFLSSFRFQQQKDENYSSYKMREIIDGKYIVSLKKRYKAVDLKNEEEITKNWDSKYGEPLVSIMCLAYNHEKYIEDALVGFLIQKTNFPFEVLIHDDASVDKTVDVIKKYEKRYPNIIKPIYQKKNLWSRDKELIGEIQYKRMKGKYIAYCEGDDYWIDEHKIQKQVDFLNEHDEYNIVFHDVYIDNKDCIFSDYITRKVPNITGFFDLLKGNYIHTCSALIRNNQKKRSPKNFRKVLRRDYYTYLLNSENGLLYKIDEVMGVYRVHDGGTMNSMAKRDKIKGEIKDRYFIMKDYKSYYVKYHLLKKIFFLLVRMMRV